MADLAHCKVVIIVFAMDGCPHCEDFSPRFDRMVKAFQKRGAPLVYYDGNRMVPHGYVPIVVVDGASSDPSVQSYADQHGVEGMPTTLVLTWAQKPLKYEGAIDDKEIYDLLVHACEANR